jgi:hypothetical protein
MQAHRSTLDPRMHPSDARVETVRAYRNAHREESLRHGLRALVDAYNEAARKPLTVADIPAGDGIASLFIAADADGKPSLWRQCTDGAPEVVYRPPSHGSKGEALLWALIEAHVPTVTD